MAIETLAAIGLAGNIAQFVDFSCKTYNSAKEIYNSASGAGETTQNLLVITNDLKEICENLQDEGSSYLTVPGDSLSSLALECLKAGTEMLTALESVSNQKPGSKWGSFRAALLVVWKQSKINEMEIRLDRCRSQLILRLQELQMQDTSQMLSRLEAIQQQNITSHAKLDQQNNQPYVTILDAIKKLELEVRRQQQDSRAKVYTDPTATKELEAAQQVPILTKSLLLTSTTYLELLRTLCFEGMAYRYGSVAEAYPKTFHWMFSNNFMEWLQSNSSLFWISGKPGSGKSTLMKFLVQEDRTMDALQTWAGNQQLVVSNYFFWTNGTKMQRSDEGLLRSIFYDILRQCPYLIKDTFPTQWTMISAGHHEAVVWNRSELIAGFRRLVQHNGQRARICIFIDGLDEYDGDCDELVDIVRCLGDTETVKLCVASRPWNVFEAAFGGFQNEKRKLYLQELNRADIETYVQDKIGSRDDFCRLKVMEPGADELVEEITTKSQGVFLWVYLVVRSLIEGLQNADRIVDLQRRLQEFPSDLNEFFSNIFNSLDKIYRVQVARSFQAALSAFEPLTLLNYYFLDLEETNPHFADSMPVEQWDTSRLLETQKYMRIRLNGRCKGLLEVSEARGYDDLAFSTRVDFLHRTVKDFLLTREMDSLLKTWNAGFEPHLALARTTLAEIKCTRSSATTIPGFGPYLLLFLLPNFFKSVKAYEVRHNTSLDILVDELQKIQIFRCYNDIRISIGSSAEAIMSLSLSLGLNEYAKAKYRQGLVENYPAARISMLIFILNPEHPRSVRSPKVILEEFYRSQKREKKEKFDNPHIKPLALPDPELVRLLLEHGPAVRLKTAYLTTLLDYYKLGDDEQRKCAKTILELLLRARAIKPDDTIREAVGQLQFEDAFFAQGGRRGREMLLGTSESSSSTNYASPNRRTRVWRFLRRS